MSAIERARQDLEQNDFGAARVRLASYLRGKGFDAALLDELGRISLAMHDPYQAGRYWFASGVAHEEAQRAIDHFQKRAGREGQSLLAALPTVVRLTSFGNLPADAQRRLRERGLETAFCKLQRRKAPCSGRQTAGTKILGVVLAIFLVLALFAFVVGLITIVGWIRS